MSTEQAIKTEQLSRVYKMKKREARAGKREIIALDRVDLEIPTGELFGLLGPNGAGKTTVIKILTTLLAPTGGRAWVAGVDVAQNPWEVRRHINVVSGGESSGYGLLTVEENLWMFTQFYGIDGKTARRRIQELLEIVGLADRAKTKIYHLSTGMRQKMNFVRGFLTNPEVLFLDEPTLGLDVQTSRTLRGFIKDWISKHPDKTVLLTTHYMYEADELCNRVAIIHDGRILACDTPGSLKRRLRREVVYQLRVDEGRILRLTTEREVFEFTREFADRADTWKVDWAAVAERWDGIEIAPYQWGCRMDVRTRWYYGWDVASGCLWAPEALVGYELEEEIDGKHSESQD